MKELIRLDLPLGNEIMTTVRLATGGVCSLAGLDLDASEDCKVCVTESLLLLKHAGFEGACVRFSQEEGLAVSVVGRGEAAAAEEAAEDEISAALLGALAEDVVAEKRDGRTVSVCFRFRVR